MAGTSPKYRPGASAEESVRDPPEVSGPGYSAGGNQTIHRLTGQLPLQWMPMTQKLAHTCSALIDDDITYATALRSAPPPPSFIWSPKIKEICTHRASGIAVWPWLPLHPMLPTLSRCALALLAELRLTGFRATWTTNGYSKSVRATINSVSGGARSGGALATDVGGLGGSASVVFVC